jgi:hypothetical protein
LKTYFNLSLFSLKVGESEIDLARWLKLIEYSS